MIQHTIDAKGRKLGRIATEAATHLRGKNTPDFTPNLLSKNTVHITNASKLFLGEKKRTTKTYIHYTGHPGGLRTETMEEIIQKKGHGEVLRRAILRMLPKNTLRPKMMKQLTIEE